MWIMEEDYDGMGSPGQDFEKQRWPGMVLALWGAQSLVKADTCDEW